MKKIESSSNEQFKELKSLLNAKGIKARGEFLVFGEKAQASLLLHNPKLALQVITCPKLGGVENYPALKTILQSHAEKSQIRSLELSNTLFEELNPFGISEPILLARTPEIFSETLANIKPSPLALVLPLGDPANLGAILRSAVAFGITQVVLLKEAANPFHPKAIRSASGAQFLIEFFQGPSINDLASNLSFNAPLITLDMGGENLNKFSWPQKAFLLLGEEGPGLPVALRSSASNQLSSAQIKVVSIPKSSDIESLNAMVAGSIAMFSFRQQYPLS